MTQITQNMSQAEAKLTKIKHRIRAACEQFKRPEAEITLIGASKTKPAELIRNFHLAGLRNFGENYLNEALDKQKHVSDLAICWHYIGQIQSNKTRQIANHFQWVHSIDRLKIAERLNEQNRQNFKLNILIQINLDDENSKAGININDAKELCQQISQLDKLRLRGFMALPKPRKDFIEQRDCLQQLSTLKDEMNTKLDLSLDTISAGMSNDLEAAIAAGSTMIRVGTDLFGRRD